MINWERVDKINWVQDKVKEIGWVAMSQKFEINGQEIRLICSVMQKVISRYLQMMIFRVL